MRPLSPRSRALLILLLEVGLRATECANLAWEDVSPDGLATDVEALAYMYPRALEAPLNHDWTQIYLYLGTKVMEARLTSKGGRAPR